MCTFCHMATHFWCFSWFVPKLLHPVIFLYNGVLPALWQQFGEDFLVSTWQHKEMVLLLSFCTSWKRETWLARTEPRPRPHPTTFLMNWDSGCEPDLITQHLTNTDGASPCSQAPRTGGEPESIRVECCCGNTFVPMAVLFGLYFVHSWMKKITWFLVVFSDFSGAEWTAP